MARGAVAPGQSPVRGGGAAATAAYRTAVVGYFRERAGGAAFELDGSPGSPAELAQALGWGSALSRGLRLLPKSLRPTKSGAAAAEAAEAKATAEAEAAMAAAAAVAAAATVASEVTATALTSGRPDAPTPAMKTRGEGGEGAPAGDGSRANPPAEEPRRGAASLLAKHALESTSAMLLPTGGERGQAAGGAAPRLGQEMSRPVSSLGTLGPAPTASPPRYHAEVLERAKGLGLGGAVAALLFDEAGTDSGDSSPWPSSDEEGSDGEGAPMGSRLSPRAPVEE